jgi:5-bromo-4-chloroindolyl phosphate hydrolysis protein
MMKWMAPGMGSGAAFLTALFVLNVPFALSVGVGVSAYAGLSLLLDEEKRKLPALPGLEGMTQQDVQKIVRDGHVKVARIRSLGRELSDRRVGAKIEAICALADKIYDDLKEDPKDLRIAKRFTDYYLDATVLVTERYADLSPRENKSPELRQVLAKFDDLLDTILFTFDKQYQRLLRDDVLNLDTEITVLKQIMETEG